MEPQTQHTSAQAGKPVPPKPQTQKPELKPETWNLEPVLKPLPQHQQEHQTHAQVQR
jgi:hypothetical protein